MGHSPLGPALVVLGFRVELAVPQHSPSNAVLHFAIVNFHQFVIVFIFVELKGLLAREDLVTYLDEMPMILVSDHSMIWTLRSAVHALQWLLHCPLLDGLVLHLSRSYHAIGCIGCF